MFGATNRIANGETDGDEIEVSAGGGYEFIDGDWSYGPVVRVYYLNTDIDSFTETGAAGLNLTYQGQDIRSLTGVVGAQASYAMSMDFGILSPQVRAEYEHEFDDDSRLINVQYAADPAANTFAVTTDDPDRNYFRLGAGVSAIFPQGASAFADFETVLGRDDIDDYLITAGVRLEF